MPRARIPMGIQRAVVERARRRCEYCQSLQDYATESTFAVEHVLPLSRGGTSEQHNLALSCSGCNGYKHSKTTAPDPVDGTMVSLYNPRQQEWQEHFSWTEDYTRVIGLTPVGRATVATLQLNRPGLVNMRQVLYLVGKHPPESSAN